MLTIGIMMCGLAGLYLTAVVGDGGNDVGIANPRISMGIMTAGALLMRLIEGDIMMNDYICQIDKKAGERQRASSGAPQRALEKEVGFGDMQYWEMFRAMLEMMTTRTKLTRVDAVGLASGGICIGGDANGCRLILTLQIEEKED